MPCGTKSTAQVGHRVVEPGAAVRAHRHPGHRLDAAREDQVLPARTDLGGGQVDGLQARGTEAVLLDAGHRVRQPGGDGGDPGDVGALVADRPTTPSTMSSIAAGSRPGKRCRISWMRPTTRSMGLVPCRAPFALPRPRGVRIASYTYASVLTGRPFAGVGGGRVSRCPRGGVRQGVVRVEPSSERVVDGGSSGGPLAQSGPRPPCRRRAGRVRCGSTWG